MRLTFKGEIGQAVIGVTASGVESQGPVVVNPRGQPKHGSTALARNVFGPAQQVGAQLGPGKGFLHLQTQQFSRYACGRKLMAGIKGHLREANQVAPDLGHFDVAVSRRNGGAEACL